MKNVCIICGNEFEGRLNAKLCSDKCKAVRKAQYRNKSAVEPEQAVEVIKAVKEEVVKKEVKAEVKKEVKKLDENAKWILTVKDKSTKTFKNIVFFTSNVKVAHEYIDRMREEKVLSFISLADTVRIQKYLATGEVTREFRGNLNALSSRKVPQDPKVMYTNVFNAIEAVQSNEGTIEVDVVMPEPQSTNIA